MLTHLAAENAGIRKHPCSHRIVANVQHGMMSKCITEHRKGCSVCREDSPVPGTTPAENGDHSQHGLFMKPASIFFETAREQQA
jgi:hypothetical protein